MMSNPIFFWPRQPAWFGKIFKNQVTQRISGRENIDLNSATRDNIEKGEYMYLERQLGLPVRLSVCLSSCRLSGGLSVCLSISLLVCLFVCCMFDCISTSCLSVCLSVSCLPICHATAQSCLPFSPIDGHSSLLRNTRDNLRPGRPSRSEAAESSHVPGYSTGDSPGSRVSDLQAVPTLKGPPDPRTDPAGVDARTGLAHIFPADRCGTLQQCRLLCGSR